MRNNAYLCKRVDRSTIPLLMVTRETNLTASDAPAADYADSSLPLNHDPAPEASRRNAETRPHQTHAHTLRVLFPNLPEAQLGELTETLHGYCAIVWRIYERLARERPEVIDELMRNRRIGGKVDSSK